MMTDEYSLQDLLEQFKSLTLSSGSVWIRTWWSWLANWGLVFWDSAFSLLICSWFGQKDGTYRVVYGTELDKITGSVKLSVVGYGRKTQEGDDTLGGRSELLSPKCLPLYLTKVPSLL
jgi:hypothetical protein